MTIWLSSANRAATSTVTIANMPSRCHDSNTAGQPPFGAGALRRSRIVDECADGDRRSPMPSARPCAAVASTTSTAPAATPASAHSGAITIADSTVQAPAIHNAVRRGTVFIASVRRGVPQRCPTRRAMRRAARRAPTARSPTTTPINDSTSAMSSLRCCVHSMTTCTGWSDGAIHQPLNPPSTELRIAERTVRARRLPRRAVAVAEHQPAPVGAILDSIDLRNRPSSSTIACGADGRLAGGLALRGPTSRPGRRRRASRSRPTRRGAYRRRAQAAPSHAVAATPRCRRSPAARVTSNEYDCAVAVDRDHRRCRRSTPTSRRRRRRQANQATRARRSRPGAPPCRRSADRRSSPDRPSRSRSSSRPGGSGGSTIAVDVPLASVVEGDRPLLRPGSQHQFGDPAERSRRAGWTVIRSDRRASWRRSSTSPRWQRRSR